MESKEQVVDPVIKVSILEWGWKLVFLGSFMCHYFAITPWTLLFPIMLAYWLMNRPMTLLGGKKPQDVVASLYNKGYDLGGQSMAVLDVVADNLRQKVRPYLPLPPATPGRKLE